MDRNFFLAMALSFLVLVTWSMYAERQRPPEAESSPASEGGEAPVERAGAPGSEAAPTSVAGTGERGEMAGERLDTAGVVPIAQTEPAAPSRPERRTSVSNALVEAEFTSRGGGLVSWKLLEYATSTEDDAAPVEMVSLDDDAPLALVTPFRELGFGDQSQADYDLDQPDARTLVYSLERGGVRIRKTYLLPEQGYDFRLRIEVVNGSDRYVRPTFLTVWPAVYRESSGFKEFSLAAYAADSLEQAPIAGSGGFLLGGGGGFDEVIEHTGNVDWAGARSRYFLAALLPDVPREAAVRFTPVDPGRSARAEIAFNAADVPPGQRLEREYRVYLGPKETELLDAVGAHLDEAILKGWFPPLTRFFTWLLMATYSIVRNYGVAIILITVLVRALMAPIMARQMRSMKRLSGLQPKIKKVQEQYPDDRQKQSEAMMAVYKEAGMSPFSAMAGCFPMLLQLPVFIGFYYALQGAIQLRHQAFFGWMSDLSAPEQLFVIPGLELPVRLLPLMMGGSMVLQQRLTPTTMDPAQARMMLTVMPVMFTVLFYQFASGLVLYWLVSNLLGIAQQVMTNRSSD